MMTSPPRPPSPPLGPPRGTNFSRRKAMQPLPPSPAFTRIRTSSMNNWKGLLRDQAVSLDADKLAHPAAVAELHDAGDLRKQRIVLAPADVLARFDLGAALPHDDRSAGNKL